MKCVQIRNFFWSVFSSPNTGNWIQTRKNSIFAHFPSSVYKRNYVRTMCTAWKVLVFGVFLVCIFPQYGVPLRHQTECRKIWTRKTPNTGIFLTVVITEKLFQILNNVEKNQCAECTFFIETSHHKLLSMQFPMNSFTTFEKSIVYTANFMISVFLRKSNSTFMLDLGY